jgi:hypothetical protein
MLSDGKPLSSTEDGDRGPGLQTGAYKPGIS